MHVQSSPTLLDQSASMHLLCNKLGKFATNLQPWVFFREAIEAHFRLKGAEVRAQCEEWVRKAGRQALTVGDTVVRDLAAAMKARAVEVDKCLASVGG